MKTKKLNWIKSFFLKNFINAIGWRSQRKILVIESDDWGTIRMSSRQAYEALLNKGYPVNHCGYNRNDALETNQDLLELLDTFLVIKNEKGQHPIITMNTIMANPIFEKIREFDFQKYHFEPFTETLKRYEGRDKVMELYRTGIEQGIFRPQLHGREHVNVSRWLNALLTGNQAIRDAFEWDMFSLHASKNPAYTMEYMDALSPQNQGENEQYKLGILEAAALFNSIFGFRSETFIAPCFIWDTSIHSTLKDAGVDGIQGMFYQNQPTYSTPKYRTIYHYGGQALGKSQYYLLRNVSFEPALNTSKDWVGTALKEIDLAFKWGKPAIISSHRVNYIGAIHPENRANGLKLLKSLLEKVIKKYPEVDFMSSDQLLREMKKTSR